VRGPGPPRPPGSDAYDALDLQYKELRRLHGLRQAVDKLSGVARNLRELSLLAARELFVRL